MPWIAWAVVRTFGLDGVHPLTGAMAFTPFVAATAPLPLIAALALRSPIVSAVALGGGGPTTVRVRRLSVHEIPGSDHRAIIAELVLPARGAT